MDTIYFTSIEKQFLTTYTNFSLDSVSKNFFILKNIWKLHKQ